MTTSLPVSGSGGRVFEAAVAAYLGVQMLRVHDLPFMAHVARMAALMRPRGATSPEA